MRKHFVTFFSPGTFVAETSEKPISGWRVAEALGMVSKIEERYGARPYGFQFSTRARGPRDLDSKVVRRSHMYYLPHCRVIALKDVPTKEEILRSNMKNNGWDRVVQTTKGWAWSQPFNETDVLLTAPPREASDP